jgi:hypothetical protein
VRIRLGGAYELFDGRGRVLAEVESRVARLDYRATAIEIVGDVPLETIEERTVDLQSTHVRLGAEYAIHGNLIVRAGLDRIGFDDLAEVRPGTGFTIEQEIGRLRAGFEYAVQLEPYAVGTFHIVAIRLFL